MSKERLGLIVIFASLFAGVLLGTIDQLFGGGIRVLILVWPALGVLLGVLIGAGVKLTDLLQLSDEVETFHELISDDVNDLQAGQLNPPFFYGALTVAGAIAYGFVIVRYQKWYAAWGKANVLLVAILVTAVMAFLAINSHWFQTRRWRFPARVFIIPAVGFAATLIVGVHWAEPMEYGGMSRLERSQVVKSDRYWAHTRSGGGRIYVDAAADAADVGIRFIDLDGLLDFDCDDDFCGYVFLVIILVVLVALLLIASATVPHFWVVASMLLLMIMMVVTMRELLYRPGHRGTATS